MESQTVVKTDSVMLDDNHCRENNEDGKPDMILYSAMMETRSSSNVHYTDESFVSQSCNLLPLFLYEGPNNFSVL